MRKQPYTPGTFQVEYAPVRTAGHTRWEKLKRWVVGMLAAILLTALQTTLLARIPLPFLSPASPSLTLLVTLAAGFFLGEREGAVMGIIAGFFAEAASGGGIMILPLLYTLCGFLTGALSREHLGSNLLSFMAWAAVAGVWEQAMRYVVAAITVRSLPSAAILLRDLFPHLILTLCFAPMIYGVGKLTIKLFDRL